MNLTIKGNVTNEVDLVEGKKFALAQVTIVTEVLETQLFILSITYVL